MSGKEFTVSSFRDFLAEGRIMGSRCRRCGGVHLPPRPICPGCGGRELEWTELSGWGTVRAYTVIHIPLSRMVDQAPYACGVVELDEGPRISGFILGASDGGEIAVGSRVEAVLKRGEGRTAILFRIL